MQSDRPKLEDLRGNLNIGMTLQSAKNIAKLGSKMLYAPVSHYVFLRSSHVCFSKPIYLLSYFLAYLITYQYNYLLVHLFTYLLTYLLTY